MTPDDDVRAMEIAAKLVLGVLVLLSVGFVAACLESVLKNGRRRAMTQGDEVRAMEIATKLVDGRLCWASTAGLNDIGSAMVELTKQVDSVEEIRAVGELLEALTERCRGAIARGERWGKGSRALSQGEGQKVLLGLTIDQVKKFSDRWGYGRDEAISWAMGYSQIPHGMLVALGDVDEMAKITGGER